MKKNGYGIFFIICSGEKSGGEKNFTKRIRCVARLIERSEYSPRFQDKDLGLNLNRIGEHYKFRDNDNCGCSHRVVVKVLGVCAL